jgi:hypothetical protein
MEVNGRHMWLGGCPDFKAHLWFDVVYILAEGETPREVHLSSVGTSARLFPRQEELLPWMA